MRKKIELMSQPELVDEIVSLRLTCDELHQENKRLKKALKDICEPSEAIVKINKE